MTSQWTQRLRVMWVAFAVLGGSLGSMYGYAADSGPQLVQTPIHQVSTELLPISGQVIEVPADGDFQAALNLAQPGDAIELEAGASYQGPFTLSDKPGKPGTNGAGVDATESFEWIIIRSSAMQDLPPEGVRVDPSYAPYMPKLVARSGPILVTDGAAHHYRFIGIEFHPFGSDPASASQLLGSIPDLMQGRVELNERRFFITNLIILGNDETDIEELPHHLIFDRTYLRGDPELGARRGIAMNSRHTAVIDSHLSGFMEQGADSQAIAGWNGPGPFKIVNNYLEAAGENVMFGGAPSSIDGLVPSDIEIRHNHFYKPLHWRISDSDYAGTPWSVKNLFELKNARRVLIDGNVFEHNWPHSQNGFAILFTVRNEGGAMPWAVVEDVSFTNNLLRGIGSGFNMLGRDDNDRPSLPTRNILIRNNLLSELGGSWGGGTFLQLLDGVDAVTVDRNTVFNSGNIILSEGLAHKDFAITHNILQHNANGIIGTGTGVGRSTLARYFPGASVSGNVIVGGCAVNYPHGNEFPRSLEESELIHGSAADFRINTPPSSQGQGDEQPGADLMELCHALSLLEQQRFCEAPVEPGPADLLQQQVGAPLLECPAPPTHY